MGLLLRAVVHSASISDSRGARRLIIGMLERFERLRLIWVDGGYQKGLLDWVLAFAGWTMRVVKRPDSTKGFAVLPKRWILERTFAWIGNYRRSAKDYEHDPKNSETIIYSSMIHLMLCRLA
jgi:putative transposase